MSLSQKPDATSQSQSGELFSIILQIFLLVKTSKVAALFLPPFTAITKSDVFTDHLQRALQEPREVKTIQRNCPSINCADFL